MNRKSCLLILSLFLIMFIFGCSRGVTVEEQIENVVRLNLEAFNNEDLETYMSTISNAPHSLENDRNNLTEFFAKYDVHAEIESLVIKDILEHSGKATVVQITRKKDKSDFKDYKMKVIHTLVNKDGTWRIIHSNIIEKEYL